MSTLAAFLGVTSASVVIIVVTIVAVVAMASVGGGVVGVSAAVDLLVSVTLMLVAVDLMLIAVTLMWVAPFELGLSRLSTKHRNGCHRKTLFHI